MMPEGNARKPRVLIVESSLTDGMGSMRRYSVLVARAYSELGFAVTRIGPSRVFSNSIENTKIKKVLRYFEHLIIFPCILVSNARKSGLIHFCDHSDALLIPLIRPTARIVVSVHDLIAVQAAQGVYPERRVRFLGRLYQRGVQHGLRLATELIAVSKHTQDEVRAVLHRESRLWLNCLDPELSDLARAEDTLRTNTSEAFALMVMHADWRKKRLDGIQTWFYLRSLHENRNLVLRIVGSPLTSEEHDFLSGVGVLMGSEVRVLSGVSERVLAELYRDCKVLIQMSKYEGFGWPVIEAAVFGTPSICRDIEVLREIAPDNTEFLKTPTEAKSILIPGRLTEHERRIVREKYSWQRFILDLEMFDFSREART